MHFDSNQSKSAKASFGLHIDFASRMLRLITTTTLRTITALYPVPMHLAIIIGLEFMAKRQ